MKKINIVITEIQLYEAGNNIWLFCVDEKNQRWPYDDVFKAAGIEKAKQILLKKMLFHYNDQRHFFRAKSIDRINCKKILKSRSHLKGTTTKAVVMNEYVNDL